MFLFWFFITGLVLWYHGDALVQKGVNKVKVETEVQDVTTSRLIIARASVRDSGNYSCWPSGGRSDSILVHVIQGETDNKFDLHSKYMSTMLNYTIIFGSLRA